METAVAVKSNEFEKLLEKIEVERKIAKNSELNVARQFEILKTMASVYFFLRETLGMPYRAISLEEFEIAQARLKLIAQEEVKKFWCRFWGTFGRKTFWHYYLEFGHFKNCGKRTVIGVWNHYSYAYTYYSNNIEKLIEHSLDSASIKFPPDAKELMDAIFEKKYGVAKT